jgi:hypothetical protein
LIDTAASAASVPEPQSLLLGITALALFGCRRRRACEALHRGRSSLAHGF